MFQALTPVQRDLMIQCLLLAGHGEREWGWNGQIVKCKPGQFITSLESLRKLCAHGTTIRKIRTAIAKLEKWKFLTKKATKSRTRITICNWSLYQESSEVTDKDNDTGVTQKRQRTDKEVTTNKNVKKGKNEESKKGVPIPAALQNENFLQAWRDFKEHRRQMRNSMTPLAQEKMLKKLDGSSVETAIAMLEQSIINGWTGVFEPNSNKRPGGQANLNRGGGGVVL